MKQIALKPTKPIKLRSGDSQEVASLFKSLYADAQNGLRRVVAFGLYAWQIKLLHLKHGQFGKWCDQEFTDGLISSRSVRAYMSLTESALEHAGIKSLKNFIKNQMGGSLPISHSGEFLLLPDAKVPDQLKPTREKLFSVIDGKSQRQLFAEFKQAEDDDDGESKPKRGRLKGQGGASKEQRAAAKAAAQQAEIDEMEITAGDFCKWIDDVGDVNHLPKIADKLWNKLFERITDLRNFMTRINEGRKGGAK